MRERRVTTSRCDYVVRDAARRRLPPHAPAVHRPRSPARCGRRRSSEAHARARCSPKRATISRSSTRGAATSTARRRGRSTSRAKASGCEQSDFDGFSRRRHRAPAGAAAASSPSRWRTPSRPERLPHSSSTTAGPAARGRSAGPSCRPASTSLWSVARTPSASSSPRPRGRRVPPSRRRWTTTARETTNVLAELPGRDDGGVVLLGAHLDSVAAGPGHQRQRLGRRGRARDGRAAPSGSAPGPSAASASPSGRPRSSACSARARMRRASTTPDERRRVLNFDMVGSPNFARLVYDGRRRDRGGVPRLVRGARPGRSRRSQLEGRSDHAPFAELGIPVGGLFTGADEPKTAAEGPALRRRGRRGARRLLPPGVRHDRQRQPAECSARWPTPPPPSRSSSPGLDKPA